MGGKTKQSQRTKNNARPSSSGRSAELLNVKLDSGIVNTGSQLPALFPSLVAPIVDPMTTPELQLCLKKLNKKDPITKIKALQELSEQVANNKVEDVVSILPSWSHFYKILTADPDRKVRECTQACHGTIMGVCGRRVAPHLKQLVPAWLQAQYDEHAPAMTHAQQSLSKTFPDNKLPEVLSFCKDEIITHLLDILIGNGEAALIRKCESAEERSMQMSRVLSSSLHALQYCLTHMAPALTAWMKAQLVPLLEGPAFWKKATNTDVKIRSAWFGTIGGLISRFKAEFGAQYGVKTLKVLLGGQESNPIAAAQLWDCLLLFMHNVPDWHQYLENKELLSKRILDVLESGGWGDARHLSNMLLPILASLPEEMMTEHFHISFFNAIFSGLDKKCVISSKSERQSWVSGMQECLRFLSAQAQAPHAPAAVGAVLRTWLLRALRDREGHAGNHLLKHSASSMADLVEYWAKRARLADAHYDLLIRNFWLNLGSTLSSQVDALSPDRADVEKLIDAHILLLLTLKSAFKRDSKKRHSIKFEMDASVAEENPPAEPRAASPAVCERCERSLAELVQDTCARYFEFASRKEVAEPVLSPLITLLTRFNSESVFGGIARRFGCRSVYEFYENVLRGWLRGDTMRCSALVDIVFMIMYHVTEQEQRDMFDTFKQFPPSVVEWCISLSLSHPHCESPSVRRWLKGDVVEATVASVCKRVIDTGDNKARNLLMMCLNCDANGESTVSAGAVENAMQQVSASLREVQSAALEARCGVAAQLAATLPPHPALLAALLELTTALQRGDGRLSVDSWCEVVSAWQDGVTSLRAPQRAALLQDAAAKLSVRSKLFITSLNSIADASVQSEDRSCSLSLGALEHLVSLCPHLLWRNCDLDVAEVVLFTQTVFDSAPEDPLLVEAYAIRHEILAGNLNCPYGENDVTKAIIEDALPELSKEALADHAGGCLFRAVYLRTVLRDRPDRLDRCDRSDRSDQLDNGCNQLLGDKYFEDVFIKCIHDYTVMRALYEGYAFWPHYKLIEQCKNRLETLLDDIINEINADNKSKIAKSLERLAMAAGYFWAYSRRYFEEKIKSNEASQSDDNTRSTGDKTSCPNEEARTRSGVQSGEASTEREVEVTESTRADEKYENSIQKTNASETPQIGCDKETSWVAHNLKDITSDPALLHMLHGLQANTKNSSNDADILRTEYYLTVADLYIAHSHDASVVRGLLADVTRTYSPDLIINTYYTHNHTMLYEKDLKNAAWSQVVSNSSACRYLTRLLATPGAGWAAAAHHWDFTNITLCSLLTSLELSKESWGTLKVSLLGRSALRLFCVVAPFVASIRALCERSAPSAHVAALPAEWKDIYAPDLNNNLLSIILYVLERSETAPAVSSCEAALLDALIRCTRHVSWEACGAAHRAAHSLERVVRVCCAALARPAHAAYKYLAHGLLAAVREPLVLHDALALAAWSERAAAQGEERALQLTLLHYDDAFFGLQDVVETALAHVKVCEEVCSVVPNTDAHSMALGWLLLADALNHQCVLARGDLTHQYIQIYREQGYSEPLLTTALRLLPRGVLTQASAPDSPPGTAALYDHMFTSLPDFDVYKWCGAGTVSACACRCVWWGVRGAGAGGGRGWRGAAKYTDGLILDNITRRYITPHVVKEEFALLQSKGSDIEDAEVTINRSAYEVTCVLTVDDSPIELAVSLSRRHPLVLPRLRASHAAAGNLNWILMYLGYQNGTILNALRMWCAHVNVKMERAPQCYICYCRLHHATGRLPTVHCHTCHNKFHNVCLRKWFKSSSKMTCPLCRANF